MHSNWFLFYTTKFPVEEWSICICLSHQVRALVVVQNFRRQDLPPKQHALSWWFIEAMPDTHQHKKACKQNQKITSPTQEKKRILNKEWQGSIDCPPTNAYLQIPRNAKVWVIDMTHISLEKTSLMQTCSSIYTLLYNNLMYGRYLTCAQAFTYQVSCCGRTAQRNK